jgi:hypothetical protein
MVTASRNVQVIALRENYFFPKSIRAITGNNSFNIHVHGWRARVLIQCVPAFSDEYVPNGHPRLKKGKFPKLHWLFLGLLTGKISFVMFQGLKKGWKLYPEKKKGALVVSFRKKRKTARKKSAAV